MLLKNLMEDKQLNFDQPLLSVRRQIPTLTTQQRDNRRIDSYSYQVRPQLPTYRSELKSGPIRDPGAVPFVWEHSPGQPKEERKAESRYIQKPPVAPTLPPGRTKQQGPCENKNQEGVVSCESRASPSHNENVRKIEWSKDAAKEEEEEGSDSGESDEAYVDARSTLSRTDYSFLNCSMSGMSGMEHPDVKPSRSFLKDPEAREFMMDRFLPAAKAMASEAPHAPKKQPLQQQQKPAKKTDNQCSKPALRYGPSFAKRYAYNEMEEEEEEEDSDDEYNQQAHSPSVCGLLPRFCLKGNLSLLSPVPAMSVRTRVPTSPASKVRPRSSSSGSYSEIESESKSDRAEIRSIGKVEAAELHEDKAKSRSDSGQLELHDQNEVLQCKGLKTFHEFLDDRGRPDQPNAEDPVLEKTLHVDTVHKVNSPKSRPFSPNAQDSVTASNVLEEDAVKSSKAEPMQPIDSPPPHEDLKELRTVDGDAHLLPNAQKVGDCDVSPLVWEMPRGFEENQDFTNNASLEKSEQNPFGLPPPPPLPKSPSDSWLGRTLPSINTKHSNLRPFHGAATTFEGNYLKPPKSDMKWETIVKTTKVQRRHLHYSEESLTTIPEA